MGRWCLCISAWKQTDREKLWGFLWFLRAGKPALELLCLSRTRKVMETQCVLQCALQHS